MSRHVSTDLGAYLLGELGPSGSRRVSEHLLRCRECRGEYDALRVAIDGVRTLPTHQPPPGLWTDIALALDARRTTGAPLLRARHRPAWVRRAAILLVMVGGGGGVASYAMGARVRSWAVESLAGAPIVGARRADPESRLAEGEWLETDGRSRARVSIGRLGSAIIGPGSRVRLVRAGGSEHRLEVERGQLDARVWAPPRFFLVETPAATAVDLGCIYSLRVDERGAGVLTVLSGQVELARGARSSLVVAGTSAAMRPGFGPGTPYMAGEPDDFRAALATLDFGGSERAAALDRVLRADRPGATITLWHLLPRVAPGERQRVYDRLAEIAPPPRGVTREGVLALDPGMLQRWRGHLEPAWSDERVRLWKKAWRWVWSAARGR